jgi:type IV secretory pathway VirB4 component
MTTGRRRRRRRQATHPDGAGVAAVVGPAAVEVTPSALKLGSGWAATVIVTGLPAEVTPGWLEPLLGYPGRIDVALHIEPLAPQVAAHRLKRQRARLESVRRADAEHARLDDPDTEAAAADAAELADRVARGAARLFRVGIYITVHAATRRQLAETVAHVQAVAASMMCDTVPATWRQLQGWTTTLPLGVDSLRIRRILDTDALAMAMPLASADMPAPLPGQPSGHGGVLYGLNTATGGVVWHDRWAALNHNSVVLGTSGSGKSYFTKLEILRSLFNGVKIHVIDPEDEYQQLAAAVGGTVIDLGAAGVRLNPMQIPAGDRRPDAFSRRCLFVHTVVNVLTAAAGQHKPAEAEMAALDAAIIACYEQAGITTDPSTWHRPAPLLRDVTTALHTHNTPQAAAVAARLTPWTHGSFKGLLDGATTHQPQGHLVVWSIRQLADELRPPAMVMALDAIWREVDTPPQPGQHDPHRLVVVDEAWTMIRGGPEGARFLERAAKSLRKRNAGLLVTTQEVKDLLTTELGQSVIANAATRVLMAQEPQAITQIRQTFNLTAAEAQLLLQARRGEGLMLSGTHRITFEAVSSQAEHQLCRGHRDAGQQP